MYVRYSFYGHNHISGNLPMKYTGVKFIVFVFFIGLFASIIPVKHAEPGMSITAPDGYAIACVSGFVRAAPHYCVASGALSGTTITNAACSQINFTLPDSTRAWSISVQTSIIAKNAVAARGQQFSTWLEVGCTNLIYNSNWTAYEHVAVAGSAVLVTHTTSLTVKATTTGASQSSIFYKTLAATEGDVVLYITGYYD